MNSFLAPKEGGRSVAAGGQHSGAAGSPTRYVRRRPVNANVRQPQADTIGPEIGIVLPAEQHGASCNRRQVLGETFEAR